jgi:hypothetical protein
MAAIDFPDSPSVGDTYTVGDRGWLWDGTVWQSQGSGAVTGPTGATGATGEAYANLDGGFSDSTYGGITAIDGGTSA